MEGALAALLLLLWIQRWGLRHWQRGWGGRVQAHAANLEILFETVRLEEIGEFKGADIAALGTDLALEIKDDRAHVLERVTGSQEFKPHAFAVKSQPQGLAGQLELLLEVVREALARILYPIACRLVNNLVVWAWRPGGGFLNGHLWQQC